MDNKTLILNNANEFGNYLILTLFICLTFVGNHKIFTAIILAFFWLLLFCLFRRNIIFSSDNITIKRIYAPFLKTININYSTINKVSLIVGTYMYRRLSTVGIHFNGYLNIEYMFKDDIEREEFLKLLVKKM